MAKRKAKKQYVEIPVIKGEVLGVTVFRGYAKLSELAKLSRPDIYDQATNPSGTQRDLSAKHARSAYEYIKSRKFGYWPELFLCARVDRVVRYKASESNRDIGTLLIDEDLATKSRTIAISRVDGNHRLHYADGSQADFPQVDKNVSFCMTVGLTPEQEIILFRDINDNQMRMNTSHLDNIEARLTPEETLKRDEPALYIAKKLGTDRDSPLKDRVYTGGKKLPGHDVPLRTLHTGIEYMLSRPTKLTALREADGQYKVIRNYFLAVKKWQPKAWSEPRKYIVLRGSGLWAICFIGADVIDRALAQGKFSSEDMLRVLRSGNEWDWTNKGDFEGYGGRGGAMKICDLVTKEFQDKGGISMKSLYRKIMATK
jgi:DGQHR domain-containing protein